MELLILTPEETATALRTKKLTVQKLIESGDIPAYREGRNWKVPEATLKEYVVARAMKESEERRKANGEA